MAFSLGGGLSALGKSISETAGNMMLENQRSHFENERIQLANTLAEKRDIAGDKRQHDNRILELQESGIINRQNLDYGADVDIRKAGALADAERQRLLEEGNDPEHLKAVTALRLAENAGDLAQLAQADLAHAQLVGVNLANQNAQEIDALQKNYADAKTPEEKEFFKEQINARGATKESFDNDATRNVAIHRSLVQELDSLDLNIRIATGQLAAMDNSDDQAAYAAKQIEISGWQERRRNKQTEIESAWRVVQRDSGAPAPAGGGGGNRPPIGGFFFPGGSPVITRGTGLDADVPQGAILLGNIRQ
jgi:hypothetical protein